jgi:hypothetical protein
MERRTEGLPSRDFFVKTLDRPHYPAGTARNFSGHIVDDDGDRVGQNGQKLDEDGTPLVPPKPQQQVSNTPSTTLASAQKP